MRLYTIQLAAILAVWLGMYYPGLDIILAGLFLLVVWGEADYQRFSWLQQSLIAIIWQLPAFFLSMSVLLGLDKATDFSYYFIIMLQLWHTPLLPLTTVQPDLLQLDKPFYYYELFVMTPLLWMVYFLPRLKRLLPGRPIN